MDCRRSLCDAPGFVPLLGRLTCTDAINFLPYLLLQFSAVRGETPSQDAPAPSVSHLTWSLIPTGKQADRSAAACWAVGTAGGRRRLSIAEFKDLMEDGRNSADDPAAAAAAATRAMMLSSGDRRAYLLSLCALLSQDFACTVLYLRCAYGCLFIVGFC